MAPYDPDHHGRRSIRLRGYDYRREGAYFITVCTRDRLCLFGEVADGRMILNEAGRIVEGVWDDLPRYYPHVRLDAFVIMPNHMHGVLILALDPASPDDDCGESVVGAGFKPAPTTPTTGYRHTLSEIVRAFKTFTARRVNANRRTPGAALWQRNYYEHIVRDLASLERIRRYITDNPARWAEDPENPLVWRKEGRIAYGAGNV